MNKFRMFFLFCIMMLSACAPLQYEHIYSKQKNISEILPQDFIVQRFSTKSFILYGLLRNAKLTSNSLHVYIEGDGLAWITRTQASKNPTPTDNVTAQLAQNDPNSAAILYLARPCQYLSELEISSCQQKYWTSHRFAAEVVNSINDAINQAKQITNTKKISIIGYSGGGALAVLVAAKREDVVFLGSVAGLLDHKKWTQLHKITALKGSLNPLDSVDLVKNIKQRHLTSEDDNIVSALSQEDFCRKLKQRDACIEIDGLEHNADWHNYWNYSY